MHGIHAFGVWYPGIRGYLRVCCATSLITCIEQQALRAASARRTKEIFVSTIVLIVLSSMAAILCRTMVKHSLVLAAVLVVASATWASPASAADAPDAWITTKVKMALLVAEDVSASAVRVDTTDGKVTLHGTVASADEKARAERAAQTVKGVHELRSLLQVVEKARQETAAVADEALSAEVGSGSTRIPP